MKRLLLLLLLLFPFMVFGQSAPSPLNLCNNVYHASGILSYTGINGLTISGDSINGGGAGVYGIHIVNCTNVHITKCKIMNTTLPGIQIEGSTNVLVDSCYITNVQSGVIVKSSTTVKVQYNYFLNMNGPFPAGCATQFQFVSAPQSWIEHNYVENIVGVAQHPQDQLNVFKSNGLPGDSIMVMYNYVRGGQVLHDSGGAAGIVVGDVGGSYQVARYNIVVNPGSVGIQPQGGTNISVDHNWIYSSATSYSVVGVESGNYSGVPSYNVTVAYNRINWTQTAGTILNKWYDSSNGNPLPNGWSTNTADHTPDPGITASILPTNLIQTCSTPVIAPVISYTPNSVTMIINTSLSATPLNTGGVVTGGWTISPTLLPTNITFNTSNGVISGIPTVIFPSTTYTVSATNAGGTGHTTFKLQVNNIPAPVISYTPAIDTLVYGYAFSISPSITGSVASWSVSPSMPPGMSFSNGIISGTPTGILASTSYTVTANNSGGSGITHITLKINPAPLLITANNKTKMQGQVNPTLTVSYGGLRNGDIQPLTPPTVSTTCLTGSPLGAYPITATGAVDSRYNIAYANGILTVGTGASGFGGIRFGGIHLIQ